MSDSFLRCINFGFGALVHLLAFNAISVNQPFVKTPQNDRLMENMNK